MSRSKRRPAAPAAVLRVLCVASLAAPLAAQAGGSPTVGLGQAPAAPLREPPLQLGPVPGLTSTWHAAPGAFAVPAGTLQFAQEGPAGSSFAWESALESAAGASSSTALCARDRPGRYTVRCSVTPPAGAGFANECVLEVLPPGSPLPAVQRIEAWVDPVELPPDATYSETSKFFWGGSCAGLAELGPDHYATSVDRRVYFAAEAGPLTPLIEWRVDGEPAGLGPAMDASFAGTGTHAVSAGPPTQPRDVRLDTYTTAITSHATDVDQVEDGVPVTFTAVTQPAGFEPYLRWVSSTKYGHASPVLGQGPSFTVSFQDTVGAPFGPNGWIQWLGVRANEVKFNQDEDCQVTIEGPLDGEKVSLTRGVATQITAVIEPADFEIDHVEWIFTGGAGGTRDTGTALNTTITMVDGTNAYTVEVRVYSNATEVACMDKKNIAVVNRGGNAWATTPTVALDNEPNFGAVPDPPFVLGQERDKDSNVPNAIIVPNPAIGGQKYDDGYVTKQVNDPNGPNHQFWFIDSTTLKIDRETVINRFIEQAGPKPAAAAGPRLAGGSFEPEKRPSSEKRLTSRRSAVS